MKDLYIFNPQKAFLTLKMKKTKTFLLWIKFIYIYTIGKLSAYLTNNTTLNFKNETLSFIEVDILQLLKELWLKHNILGNQTVIENLINILVKVFIKFNDKRS